MQVREQKSINTFLYSGNNNNIKEKVKEALRDAKNNRSCV